jgi:RimJ/RimL family protein N-acetyltransferase
VLGGTGLHTRAGAGTGEIGYWVHKDYINQGLATEATAALTKVAFLIERVARVEIHCDPNNVRSAAVPRKLRFCQGATPPITWQSAPIGLGACGGRGVRGQAVR